MTIYRGSLLPRRYIGSSTIQKVKSGYNGSVSSIKWKALYDKEQIENKHLFKTRILTTHTTDIEAREMEKILHLRYNVVKSQMYINESIAVPNGHFGRDVSGANNPMYGKSRKGEKHKGGENISVALKQLYKSEKGQKLRTSTSNRLKIENPSKNSETMAKAKQTWKQNKRGVGELNGMFGKDGKLKGKILYNNGVIVKAFIPGEAPIGWIKGRIKKNDFSVIA